MGIEELLNKTITAIENNEEDRQLIFVMDNGDKFVMYHNQDCSEYVRIEEIIGDLSNLLNTPILMAEEATNKDEDYEDYALWTFYKLATIKGYVTIRWYGESNGYYGVDVTFKKILTTDKKGRDY